MSDFQGNLLRLISLEARIKSVDIGNPLLTIDESWEDWVQRQGQLFDLTVVERASLMEVRGTLGVG